MLNVSKRLTPLTATTRRQFHHSAKACSTAANDLKTVLKSKIPERREQFLKVKKDLSDKSLGPTTVASTLGGMRGNPVMYWESSKVDPNEGVTFHGKTIPECQEFLPKSKHELDDPKSVFMPESMFWFLLTGEVPSQKQINDFNKGLAENGKLPDYLTKVLDSLPQTMHPMTQLSIGVSALNNESTFAKAYERGINKADYWEYTFDDSLNLFAKFPAMVGRIYQNTYKSDYVSGIKGDNLGEIDVDQDWSHNLAQTMGYTTNSKNINNFNEDQSKDFVNLVRLYCALHADHEGGNVSSHATHLVGSALSDPYLSYSSGIQGLAGPLHGLASQEVVRFITTMAKDLELTHADIIGLKESKGLDSKIVDYLWSLLNSGRVIPGYGHAVLRKPDPRFDAMINFGLEREAISDHDVHFNLVYKLSQLAPGVLTEHGKTKNPFPNVDSSSGTLFYHYGLKETLFFTVIFAGSRAFGPLNQLIWDRILGLPIERPKSLDLKSIIAMAK